MNLLNHATSVQLLGVIFDIFGAFYLSKGLMFKTPADIKSETYGDPNPKLKIDLGTSGNTFIGQYIQTEEAKIGFWVLAIGFTLQAIGIIWPITIPFLFTLLISTLAIPTLKFTHTRCTNLERIKAIHDRD